MGAKALFLILALAFIAGSQSARLIDESDSKVQIDPCSHIFKPLYCYLPPNSSPASPATPASPVVTPPAATRDPCSYFFKPLYCYVPHASPATPAAPVVTPSTPAAPLVTPSPPASDVTPTPPAASAVTPSSPAAATCTPPLDLITNCGTFFFLSRIAHNNCCQQVNALSDTCLADGALFNLVERDLLSLAKRVCV